MTDGGNPESLEFQGSVNKPHQTREVPNQLSGGQPLQTEVDQSSQTGGVPASKKPEEFQGSVNKPHQTGEVPNQLSGGQTPQTEVDQSHQGEVGPASEGSEMPEKLRYLLKGPIATNWKEIYDFLQENPHPNPETVRQLLEHLFQGENPPTLPSLINGLQENYPPPKSVEQLSPSYLVLAHVVRNLPPEDKFTNEEEKYGFSLYKEKAEMSLAQVLGFVEYHQVYTKLHRRDGGFNPLSSPQFEEIVFETLKEYFPEGLTELLKSANIDINTIFQSQEINIFNFGEALARFADHLQNHQELSSTKEGKEITRILRNMSLGYLLRSLKEHYGIGKEGNRFIDLTMVRTFLAIAGVKQKDDLNSFIGLMTSINDPANIPFMRGYLPDHQKSMLRTLEEERIGPEGVNALIKAFNIMRFKSSFGLNDSNHLIYVLKNM